MSIKVKAEYVQESDFEQLIQDNNLVVVDYTATWCGPCRLLSPSIDRLAEEYEGKATVVKIDIDQNPNNAKEYEIRSIPTVLLFKNGELVERFVGNAPYETFSNVLEKHIQL